MLPASGARRQPPKKSEAAPIDIARARKSLEYLLVSRVISPWHPAGLDHDHGGFITRDSAGTWRPGTPKTTVDQARALWFFSQLYYSGYGRTEHLAAARSGFDFLRESMWDPVFGGFFWEVDAAGRIATKPHKHTFAQAVALSALCRYVQVSDDSTAAQLAGEVFAHLERHAYDAQFGGYVEQFRRDWGPGFAEVEGYLGVASGLKLVSTHLELIDALASYYRMAGDPAAWRRLSQLISSPANPLVTGPQTTRPIAYHRDWTPVTDPPLDRPRLGLDLASIRVLGRSCEDVGLEVVAHREGYRALFENALRQAYDEETGRYCEVGVGVDGMWAGFSLQAEAVGAGLYIYSQTREPHHAAIFARALSSLVRGPARSSATDSSGTDSAAIREDPPGEGAYSDSGAAIFHLGRALLNALEILDRLGSPTSGE